MRTSGAMRYFQNERWLLIFMSFVITTLFLIVNGYLFNQEDLEEVLPPIYKGLNPGLYPYDTYVNETLAQYTSRTPYIHFLTVLYRVFNTELIFFVICFASILLSVWSFLKMGIFFGIDAFKSGLIVALIFVGFDFLPIGGNFIQDSYCTPANIALGLTAFSIYLYLIKKYWLAGLILAIATYFQLLVGLQVFVILCIYSVLDSNYRGFWRAGLIYLSLSMPHIYLLFLSQNGQYDIDFYSKIIYTYRNPHHFVFSTFSKKSYIMYFSLLGIYFVTYPFLRVSDALKRWSLVWVGISTLGIAVYVVGFEYFGMELFAKTQWIKTSIWAYAWALMVLLHALPKFSKISISRRSQCKISLGGFCLSIGILGLIYFNKISLIEPFQIGYYAKTDLGKMHDWVKANTPTNAVVLSFPNDFGVMSQTQRSVPVSYKAIIHNPGFILPWFSRMKELYGADLVQTQNNISNLQEIVELWPQKLENSDLVKYKINYIIANDSDKLSIRSAKIVHREADLICLKIEQ